MLQLSSRPLTSSLLDRELFVDREDELGTILRSVSLRFNTLVVGESGSGKTSLVSVARRELEEAGTPVAVIAAPHGSLSDVLLRAAIDQADAPLDGLWSAEPAVGRGGTALQPAPVTERMIHQFAAMFPEDAVVVVDGLEPDTAWTLFGRFRDTLWEHRLRWLVTAQLSEHSTFLRPPADAFFTSVVELGPLSADHVRELLVRRTTGGDEDAADRLRALAARMGESGRPMLPRTALVAAARMLVSGKESNAAFAAEVAQREQARAIGYSALRLFDALRDLKGASAGDDALIARLGMSRPRIVQLLKELEADGLVASHQEGRRKVYAVVEAG